MRVEMVFIEQGERHELIRLLEVVFGKKLRTPVLLHWSSRALHSFLAYTHHNEMQYAPFLHLFCRPSSDCIWPWR